MKKIIVLILLIIVIASIFSIFNESNANDLKWDLYFDNIEITDGSITANQEAAIVGNSKSQITFDITLRVPGDFYEFTVDAVNNGTVDAMIDQIGINNVTEEQKRYIKYEVTYLDGIRVKQNDRLSAKTTERLKIRVEYKDDINPDDLPSTTITALPLILNVSYVQADENAVDKEENTVSYNNNSINTNNTASKTIVNNTENDNSKTTNNGQYITSLEANKPTTKIIQKIKNIASGDDIIKYVIVLVLATVALLLSFWKKVK